MRIDCKILPNKKKKSVHDTIELATKFFLSILLTNYY